MDYVCFLLFLLSAIVGGLTVWLIQKPKIDQLDKLTDRDERGRFKK